MAGRPLRRLRNALRLNPLVGWEDASGMSSREAIEPRAPLVKAGAREKYAEVYTRVGLPLAVFIHRDDGFMRENRALDEMLAKRLNAVVLSVTVQQRTGRPFYTRPEERRGSPVRTSPYSPFVLLHRMGDNLRGTVIANASRMEEELRDAAYRWTWAREVESDREEAALLSRGVDTSAGRMGVLGADYLSDLWAKWLLTGRVAYSPTEPPPESPEEARFRSKVAEYAPQIFRVWYDYLDRNRPMVINV